MTITESVRAARRCGTPLIIIRTADPAAAIARIKASVATNKDTPTPVIRWDLVNGARGEDEPSAEALATALREGQADQKATTNPAKFLQITRALPKLSIVFMVNLHRFASQDIGVIQSLWNLRDEFKFSNKCVIGLVPHMTLPAELQQDVLLLDDPLPTDAELKAIAVDIYNAAQLTQPDAATLEKIVDATLGLAAFPSEQAMAMSITKNGMDLNELWERKRQLISQTPGLSVVKPTVTFKDIGGVKNIKKFMGHVINSKEAPRCYVWIDEGEKMFAGSSASAGDTSGVSQGFLQQVLTTMQDEDYQGVLFVGFPGSTKSMMAKATGATAFNPTIKFDMGAMKNSLVGASEANLRTAFATVKAVSQGRAYFIMTCNAISSLPPELIRRFKDAIFFFDIPDAEEKAAIWDIYLAQYADKLAGIDCTRPNDEHWTGAEISTCVINATRFGISLRDAAAYVVPAFESMGQERAAALREEASGRFISASYEGKYQAKRVSITDNASKASSTGTKRTISFDKALN